MHYSFHPMSHFTLLKHYLHLTNTAFTVEVCNGAGIIFHQCNQDVYIRHNLSARLYNQQGMLYSSWC